MLNEIASWTASLPVDSRHLPSHVLRRRNVETPYGSRRCFGAGEWACREVGRSACGLGMSEEANATL